MWEARTTVSTVEPPLAKGSVMLLEGMEARSGQLLLTAEGLRYKPDVAEEARPVLIPLSAITHCEWSAVLRLLTVVSGEETWRFSGPGTAPVHAHLVGLLATLELQELPATPVDHTADALIGPGEGSGVEVWPASLRRGLLRHKGGLHLGRIGLRFEVRGRLDAIMGAQPFEMPWSDLTRVMLRGWPEPKIELHAGEDVRVLSVDDPRERLHALIARLHADHSLRRAAQSEAVDVWRESVVSRWPDALRVGERRAAPLCTPCLLVNEGRSVVSGVLVLTRSSVRFLPAGSGDPDDRVLDIPISRVARIKTDEAHHAGWIHIDADQTLLGFVPSGGEAEIETFWKHCRAPSRIIPWANVGRRTMDRIIGASAFVRISVQGRELAVLRPGASLRHVSGWAVMLPRERAERALHAPSLSVEVGQFEGVYQFDTRVDRSAPVPAAHRVIPHEDTWLVVMSWPEELRVYNQRVELRVPVDLSAFVTPLTERPEVAERSTIVDLSNVGCRLRLHFPVALGLRLHIDVEDGDEPFQVKARVCRLAMEGETYDVGVLFEPPTTRTAEAIARVVMDRQRASFSGLHEADEPSSIV